MDQSLCHRSSLPITPWQPTGFALVNKQRPIDGVRLVHFAVTGKGWRVQRVIATQLVVYRRVFRSPRFSEVADRFFGERNVPQNKGLRPLTRVAIKHAISRLLNPNTEVAEYCRRDGLPGSA